MNPHRDDVDLDWTPGWDWLAGVIVVHVLVVAPWILWLGPWPLIPAAVSLLHHVRVFRRREAWCFALVGERAVVFEPERVDGTRRPARLRGPPWMTERWLVVRTSRRVLVVRAGRYDAALFARLRRAFLGDGGRRWKTSRGSAAG